MRNWERPQSAGHGTSTSLSMSLSPSGQGSWTPSKTLTPRNPERHQRSHASNVQPKITPLGLSPKTIGEDTDYLLIIY
ncbi:unnamed protein product [Prunus armeniaca]|uniref:Uncharacterized protein n=1 Tax=Prunus armeniaca TaxID=36596 RepID=A0A6J5V4H9_PRUAR|nr:unnamed protein product [Prunus armeniaca]